jgi:hypothetical protein
MKCVCCDKEAIKAIRPDIDLKGIGYCQEHETDVKLAYCLMLNGEKDAFDKLLKRVKKKTK